jgi:CubicO group peptidase (beta-lactamase class C family)
MISGVAGPTRWARAPVRCLDMARSHTPTRYRCGLVVLAVVASACSGSGDAGAPAGGSTPGAGLPAAAPPAEYPGDRWRTAEPTTVGLAAGPLAEIPAKLEGTDTDCVVVLKKGVVVHESTWNGFDPDKDQVVWSVSKSITSLLVGIAVDEGKLRIEQKASDFITEWKGTPSEPVTIRNLLSMDSGRFEDYQTDFVTMPLQTDDQSAFAIGLSQQFPPGTVWAYNNAGVEVLGTILERATGRSITDYSREKLFAPIGIEATWLKDKAGHVWAYGGAVASCRDLARIGYLALHNGRWQDRQIVSEQWVRDSVKQSQQIRPNYGYLWWINVPAPTTPLEAQNGGPAPGVAKNAYFARGLFGQYIAVVPDDETVVVRTGRSQAGVDRFASTDDILNYVLRQVTTAEQAVPG